MSEHVLVSKNELGYLSITLARPERRNAITVAMYAAHGRCYRTRRAG